MSESIQTTHYPVLGAAPAMSLEGRTNYLHVATAFPQEGPPTASFEARPEKRPSSLGHVHTGVYVPTHYGEPEPKIHVHQEYTPTDEEWVALEVLFAAKEITWGYEDLGKLAVVRVWDSRHTIWREAQDGSAICFHRVESRFIVLGALRSVAEYHALNRAG